MISVIAAMIYNRSSVLPTNMMIDVIAKHIVGEYRIIYSTTDKETLDELVDIAMDGGIDKFVLVNSPTGFTTEDLRYAIGVIFYKAKVTIFAQNDYTLKPPSQCKSVPIKEFMAYKAECKDFYGFDYIFTTVRDLKTDYNQIYYCDWNKLAFNPNISKLKPYSERSDSLFYFGSFRKDRKDKFDVYFNTIEYQVELAYYANSKLAQREFGAVCPNHINRGRGDIYELLQDYKASIILCDKHSTKEYHSLPTRFYECLSAGTVMFFDEDMRYSLEQTDLPCYNDYIVSNDVELANKMRLYDLEHHAELQRQMWCRKYDVEIDRRVCDLFGMIDDVYK